MNFSIKGLFKDINKKCDRHCNGYIECAMDEIDAAFENVEIDTEFYNEYYKLKRDIEIRNLIFNAVLTGVLTGAVVSLAFEAEKKLGFLVVTILLFFGILVCTFVVKQFPTKRSAVLEPYILGKMEKMIKRNRLDKNDKS